MSPEVAEELRDSIEAIVICPSNPFVSVDPVLAVPGFVNLLRGSAAPIVAVSPIVGGKALKGPKCWPNAVENEVLWVFARHYHGLIDGMVIDQVDENLVEPIGALGIAVPVEATVIKTDSDKTNLAGRTLAFSKRIRQEKKGGSRMWAVLPIKNLANVKTRLASVLSPAERSALFRCMVHDVLSAVTAVQVLGGVLIVTRDPDIQRVAAEFGAHVLQEAANEGHNAAIALAASWLSARGEGGFMQIPGDIPTVTAEELSDVLATHGGEHQRAFTIAPSLDYDGSNCVVCTPPDLIELKFGPDSFRRHVASAHAAGIACQIIKRPGIALDIDSPFDLARLAATLGDTRTHRFLEESGIGRRVLGLLAGGSAKRRCA